MAWIPRSLRNGLENFLVGAWHLAVLYHALRLLVKPDEVLNLMTRQNITKRYTLPLISFLVLEVPDRVFSDPLVAFDISLNICLRWGPVSLVVPSSLLERLQMEAGPHRILPQELGLKIHVPKLVLLPLTDALPHL